MNPSCRSISSLPRSRLVAELREELRRLEGVRRPADDRRCSTGCEALDRLLPEQGVSRGTLVEWLADGEGSGAGWLALEAAGAACREDGPLVVVDGRDLFYPPAAASAGIDLERLIVVRVEQAADEAWALDQVLRSAGVGAVFCQSARLTARTMRRLQLAAEASGVVGLFVRPEAVRKEPCWAEARLLVRSLPAAEAGRRLRVELLRARGAVAGGTVDLEIDDETGVVRLAAGLAPAASVSTGSFSGTWRRRTARA